MCISILFRTLFVFHATKVHLQNNNNYKSWLVLLEKTFFTVLSAVFQIILRKSIYKSKVKNFVAIQFLKLFKFLNIYEKSYNVFTSSSTVRYLLQSDSKGSPVSDCNTYRKGFPLYPSQPA